MNIFEKYGYTPKTARAMGLPYERFYSHFTGIRNISAESAILYERVLGIPRYELRPDLWTREMCAAVSVESDSMQVQDTATAEAKE